MDHELILERRSQELQAKFQELLGNSNVYYNPPTNIRMNYDAIVFSRSAIKTEFANNLPYKQANGYEVTAITEDPDSPIISKLSRLSMCSFDRHYVADNLHHNVFILYD